MHVAYIHQHFATRKSATGTRSYEMSRRLIEAGHRVSSICGVNEATRGDAKSGERGAARVPADLSVDVRVDAMPKLGDDHSNRDLWGLLP